MTTQLTLARLPPGPHIVWLCIFAFLGVIITSTVRVATDMGTGIVTGAALLGYNQCMTGLCWCAGHGCRHKRSILLMPHTNNGPVPIVCVIVSLQYVW